MGMILSCLIVDFMKTSFIFPAFISEYFGNEPDILNSLSDDFCNFKNITASVVNPDFRSFSTEDKSFTNDELNSQIISYIFSCSLCNILKNKKKIIPDYVAGNSMGLYAALFCSGSVSFEDGLHLIINAYKFIREKVAVMDAGMGSIIGLDIDDVRKIVEHYNNKIEIVNANNKHSFLISGEMAGIKKVLELARDEGALFTSELNVKSPYHTHYLNEVSEKFYNFIKKNISIGPSVITIVSAVDQSFLSSKDELSNEIVRNISTPINWQATMQKMLDSDVSRFFECGAGNTLYKIGKFIKGSFTIYPINQIERV
ncbi:MAG: hypothetical protein B6D61_12560 [Bacteroidetes bacterium 4484_249]|nr:MAG: hypothetical protein B6D61_12560 [Bacteroidetes bacterium 4484_249]